MVIAGAAFRATVVDANAISARPRSAAMCRDLFIRLWAELYAAVQLLSIS
jgi:hypothetical protein